MKKDLYELYEITLNKADFWLIMSTLNSELCRISTRKKQDRKKLRQEYYNEREERINDLIDYLHECTTDKELVEMLKKF